MSQCYPKAREKFLTAQLNWLTNDIKAVFLPEAYIPDFDDEFLADIASGVRIAISELLENKTATDGYANSDPIKFPLLIDSRKASQAVIFRDTGNEATSSLIFHMSADMLLGTPLSLIGFDYFIYPDTLAGGFFRL